MKLAEALRIAQAAFARDGERFDVYLACGIFPLHLTTFLAAHLSERLPGRSIAIQTGLYGDLPGNLAQLAKSSSHAGAVVIEWSDLDPRLGLRRLGGWGPRVLPDINANAGRTALELLPLLAEAASAVPLAVCLPTLPPPPISYQPSNQLGLVNAVLQKTLADFVARAAQIPHLKLVSPQQLDKTSPQSERLDIKSDLSTGFPYRISHASNVAELLSGLIRPTPSKKGLITDLDDTLWRGLLGEEGVAGVSWDLDRHSHIHALYQQLLAALSESGILLAVASKNDPDLAYEALQREDLISPKETFFPIEVSWDQKSAAVIRILKTWNISADDVVFVDDSPLELAEVKSVHPTIECLRFPVDDEQAAYELLENLRSRFARQEILEEDIIRAASLRQGNEFEQTKNVSTQPLESFLEQVDAELTLSPVPPGDARAFELVNKTNQFNLNGRRLSEGDFAASLRERNATSLLVSYKDKYGPLGKIAVVLGRVDGSALHIETWVMSCRAFSRHIEYRCLEYFFTTLKIEEIVLDFQATERNGPVRDLLAKLEVTEVTTPVRIRRETFMRLKPALFHKINEVSYA